MNTIFFHNYFFFIFFDGLTELKESKRKSNKYSSVRFPSKLRQIIFLTRAIFDLTELRLKFDGHFFIDFQIVIKLLRQSRQGLKKHLTEFLSDLTEDNQIVSTNSVRFLQKMRKILCKIYFLKKRSIQEMTFDNYYQPNNFVLWN